MQFSKLRLDEVVAAARSFSSLVLLALCRVERVFCFNKRMAS